MAGSVDKTLRTARAQAKSGAYAEAEALYREVLARFPGNKRAQAGLAEVAHARGAGAKVPPRALVNELMAMKQAGRDREMAARAGQALAQYPGSPALIEIRAAGLAATGDYKGAAALYRELVAKFPDHPDNHGNLGNSLMAMGEDEAAEAAFRRVLELRPNDPISLNNIGNILRRKDKEHEAIELYRAAVEGAPNFAQARLNLGNLLMSHGKQAEAREQLEASLRLAPGNYHALTSLAALDADQGDKAAAREKVDAALALAPRFVEALRQKARVHTFTEGDPMFARLIEVVEDPATEKSDRVYIEFALGKAYEDIGDTAQAFAHYAAGNALRKELLGYDISQDEKLFAAIKSAFAAPYPVIPEEEASGPEPIFILGLPRSGTTLVEQIVTAHPQVAPGGELNDLGTVLFDLDWSDPEALKREGPALRKSFRETLRRLGGTTPFVTDKMPLNFRWIGAIRALFPQAKIVHLHRDPRAVLWSIYKLNFTSSGNGYAHDLDDLLAYRGLYKDLMAHWDALYGETIFDLEYEKLTEDPETVIRALIDYLDLPWDDACLRPQDNKRIARTASREQVMKPIYKGSSQAWEKFAPYLEQTFAKLD